MPDWLKPRKSPEWLQRAQEAAERASVAAKERQRRQATASEEKREASWPKGRELDDRSQLDPAADRLLSQNLLANEHPVAIIRGTLSSAMIGTDRRVFVFKKGWLSGSAGAKKLATYDYRNLTGVEVEIGIISGSVTLQGPGIFSQDMGNWDGGKNIPRQAPYAIQLNIPEFEQATRGVPRLRQLISEGQQPSGALQASSPLDELRKLGALRDAGIVTPEEFETKKADLLART